MVQRLKWAGHARCARGQFWHWQLCGVCAVSACSWWPGAGRLCRNSPAWSGIGHGCDGRGLSRTAGSGAWSQGAEVCVALVGLSVRFRAAWFGEVIAFAVH